MMAVFGRFYFFMTCIISLTLSYKTGPPVHITGVCESMAPQHGANAQTSAAPYEVVTNTDGCYKENLGIQVIVRTKSGNSQEIEGLFVQAREGSNTQATGVFSVSDPILSTLKCGTDNSAVGHNQEKEAKYREMTWTPAASSRNAITLRATVVEHKETFWVNVLSQPLTYKSNCVLKARISGANSLIVTFLSTALAILTALFFI